MQVWFVIGVGKQASGAQAGVRATSFVIRGGRAVAAVLDTHEDEQSFADSLGEAAAAAGLVAHEVDWQTAHEVLSSAWKATIAETKDATDEATYLRPWVERAILGKGDGPAGKGRIIGGAPAEQDSSGGPAEKVLEAALGLLRTRTSGEDLTFAAEAIWGDFLEASREPVLVDDVPGWSAALALASSEASEGDVSPEEAADAFGIAPEALEEWYDRLWEPIDVPDDEEDDEDVASDLISIDTPTKRRDTD